MKVKEITQKTAVTLDEKAILQRLSNGERTEIVAQEFELSISTFATRLREMRIKYKCENTTHLVAYFLRKGIIN